MPKKPTTPFGHIAFAKDGRIRREISQLSDDKATQETEAATRFVHKFNEAFPSRQITELTQLPENDHDFSAFVAGSRVHLQLTELVDRTYTFAMSEQEYRAGKWACAVHDKSGGIPRRIDEEVRDQALGNVIKAKLAKQYAKPSGSSLWLVVFTTVQYLTEYMSEGRLQVSNGLQLARQSLSMTSAHPFAEIWFTDLQTRPVSVWPHHAAGSAT
ncbi:hypothetical protein [Verrucomicrobium sp. BvORR034]|uniref:hypothetical protein n=1 Tax=Verrucomicrobium sp. BvORR034 TaxID=1396418 RepID=UPI000678D34B|nr:hypothetical protein [Verrucomicrobium sp. BvORR034]